MKFERSKQIIGKTDVIINKFDLCFECKHRQNCSLIAAIQENIVYPYENYINVELCPQFLQIGIKRIK